MKIERINKHSCSPVKTCFTVLGIILTSIAFASETECLSRPRPGVRWQRCNQVKENLKEAQLMRAQLQETIFTEAQLQGADLESAAMGGARMDGAFLASANLSGTGLTCTQIEAANEDLSYANLAGLNLSKCKLAGKNLTYTILAGVNLTGSDITAKQLELSFTNLSGTNLGGLDLSGANLAGKNLTNANLTNTNLTNANLKGAIIDDTTILNGAQLNNATWIDGKKCFGHTDVRGTCVKRDQKTVKLKFVNDSLHTSCIEFQLYTQDEEGRYTKLTGRELLIPGEKEIFGTDIKFDSIFRENKKGAFSRVTISGTPSSACYGQLEEIRSHEFREKDMALEEPLKGKGKELDMIIVKYGNDASKPIEMEFLYTKPKL